jgi:hypothetical protein
VSALILYPVGYYLLHVYPRFLDPDVRAAASDRCVGDRSGSPARSA